jgi:glycosyltransferase involved in cell wall biosynthesis
VKVGLRQRQLVRLFQGASLFVYPSFYEGFGLPPAEALACGIPIIVSNVSSLPEVIGKAGVQVDPGDAGELAMAIRDLLASPGRQDELKARGIEQAAQFRWDTAAKQMEEVFREVLGEH